MNQNDMSTIEASRIEAGLHSTPSMQQQIDAGKDAIDKQMAEMQKAYEEYTKQSK